MRKYFCSKILLFGEYSVIRKSQALSIPYNIFSGTLVRRPKKRDEHLLGLIEYLGSLKDSPIELEKLAFDVNRGLHFDSSIPQGFGLGSSGALCAALYDAYGKTTSKQVDIEGLKENLAVLESYFHGASSGLDPLISYKNCPILVKGGKLSSIDLVSRQKDWFFFLLNTKVKRKTAPLVKIFLKKCEDQAFTKVFDEIFTPLTDNCINSFLQGDGEGLFHNFRELSQFQWTYFAPMIPEAFRPLWKSGFADESFYLKLCGAGGGGYLMGITHDLEQAREKLADYEFTALYLA
jgi:mevalonate kinase